MCEPVCNCPTCKRLANAAFEVAAGAAQFASAFALVEVPVPDFPSLGPSRFVERAPRRGN
jgi:hypothetical protein